MTALRVILDEMTTAPNSAAARYAEDLTRQLIATAPNGATVAGIVSAAPEADYARIVELLPGLAELHKSPLAHRELAAAWRHGITRIPGGGMVHAPSLFAPLGRHERAGVRGIQVAVTVHDATPWTDPELVAPRVVAWNQAMVKRAERFADAVITPTHAVAEVLAERFDFGDRLRVINGAPSSRLHRVVDAAERRERLSLPAPSGGYLITGASLGRRDDLDALIAALDMLPELTLVVIGDDAPPAAADAAVPDGRVLPLGPLEDDDLAAVLEGAALFVQPGRSESVGLALLDALAFGLPVIHSDAPSLIEIAAEAGVVVPGDQSDGYSQRLGDAIRELIEDAARLERLSIAASDRVRAFSWRDSAEQVWRLHAEL